MSASILAIVMLSALLLQCTTATNILVVGDSIGLAMGEAFLEGVCAESNVCNAAISGTTAAQWAKYNDKQVKECGGDWDVVYISVGGNDSLASGCSMGSVDLAAIIQAAVTNIRFNVAPGASKYLLTGYCVPAESPNSGCADPSNIEVMSDALKLIDTEDGYVEVIDSYSVCGGSATSFSDKKYFWDVIHLNENGYCKVFTQPDIQKSLSCSEIISMDCDTLEVLPKVDSDDKIDPEISLNCTQRCASQTYLTIDAICNFSEMGSCSCVKRNDPNCFLECNSSGFLTMACSETSMAPTTDTDKGTEGKYLAVESSRGSVIFSSHLTFFASFIATVVIGIISL